LFLSSTPSHNLAARCLVAILTCSLLSSCTFLSNRDYIKQYAPYQGVHRIAVFLQHWPVYLQKPGRNDIGEDFIKNQTIFFGPWQPVAQLNPRAVDILDIDDCLMGEMLVRALERKGYQVFLIDMPSAGETVTVDMLMAQYQAINPPVDAFLFCYYAPTLFLSQAQANLRDCAKKSYSLQEIVQGLKPGSDAIIWVGNRSQMSAVDSMSHAFIYLSLTIFKASNGNMLMSVANSQVGGKVWPWIPLCPPAPTDEDYRASPGVIQNLMVDNLKCRLKHLIPDAF
jgi:hypothetical protein